MQDLAPPSSSSVTGAYISSSGHLIFEVKLIKPPGAKLGIDVLVLGVASSSSSGLIIDTVTKDGVAEAWNQRSHEPYRIHTGDIIIRVNGNEGDSLALSNELRVDSDIDMVVLRINHEAMPTAPAPPPPPPAPPQHDQRIMQARQQLDQQRQQLDQQRQQLDQRYQMQMSQLDQHHKRQQMHLQRQWEEQHMHLQRSLGQWPPQSIGWLAPEGPAQHAQPGAGPGPRAGAAAAAASAAAAGPSGGVGASQEGSWAAGASIAQSRAAKAFAAYKNVLFSVYIHRPEDAKLGFGVLPVMIRELDVLLVRQITPGGMVDKWNRHCREERTIREGDALVAVNGISLNVNAMMEAVRSQRELHFIILPQHAFHGALLEDATPAAKAGGTAPGDDGSEEKAGVDEQASALRPRWPDPTRAQMAEARGGADSALAAGLQSWAGGDELQAGQRAASTKASPLPPSPAAVPMMGGLCGAAGMEEPFGQAGVADGADQAIARDRAGLAADDLGEGPPASQVSDEAELLLRMTALDEGALGDLLEAALEARPWLRGPVEATLEILEQRTVGDESDIVDT